MHPCSGHDRPELEPNSRPQQALLQAAALCCGRELCTHLASGCPAYHTQLAPAGRCLARFVILPAQGLQVMKLGFLRCFPGADLQTLQTDIDMKSSHDGKRLKFVTRLHRTHLGCQVWGSQPLATLYFT